MASETMSGAGRDFKSLESPTHVVAVKIPEGVKLVWQGIHSGELAGYRIYRRADGAEQAEFLVEIGPDQDFFIDQSETGGRLWYYSVTSFDSAVPANESEPGTEAAIDLR
jgi:fibronectin type 3 domain-containing protein